MLQTGQKHNFFSRDSYGYGESNEEYDEDDGLDEEGKMCAQKSQERQAETKMPNSLPNGIPKWKKSGSPADDLLVTINKRMQERSKRSDREMEDDESIFGKMVAGELRSLPRKLKIMLKHEINSSIFKYQCQNEVPAWEKGVKQQESAAASTFTLTVGSPANSTYEHGPTLQQQQLTSSSSYLNSVMGMSPLPSIAAWNIPYTYEGQSSLPAASPAHSNEY